MEGDPGDYILVQILRDGSKSSLTFVVFLFSNYDDDYFFEKSFSCEFFTFTSTLFISFSRRAPFPPFPGKIAATWGGHPSSVSLSAKVVDQRTPVRQSLRFFFVKVVFH